MNLAKLSTKDLHARFLAAFGKSTTSRNRPWLIKRLKDHTATIPSVTPVPHRSAITRDLGLSTGTIIRRTWKGQELVVTVTADGFELNGTTYASLSAAATKLCGGNRNGLVFFGLKQRPTKVVAVAS
jgi:hypothetical protein